MPGDRSKSRARKIKALDEQLGGQQWRKFKTCELCGFLFCVNNYEDRKSRTPKAFGRPICAWCTAHKGKARMAEHILVERLADSPCERPYEHGAAPPVSHVCKCLPCIARRLKEKMDANAAGG